MKRNEQIRRLIIQQIENAPEASIQELVNFVNLIVTPEATENDIKSALRWLQRNEYIYVIQLKGGNGRWKSSSRQVLKKLP